MNFVLSKVIGFFVLPSNAILILFLLGIAAIAFNRRLSTIVLSCTAALSVVFAWSPLPNLMLLTLTERFPPPVEMSAAPTGIIVLGGAIEPDHSAARGTVEVNGAGERLFALMSLARRYPDARILFSGGSGNLIDNAAPEAPFAASLLESVGFSANRIVLETQSRTTEENAFYSRELLKPNPGERWLLVTSAYHMPRSVGLFRGMGFDVDAYPVDFRSRGWQDAWLFSATAGRGLFFSDLVMHELVGLVAARLSGRSDALFPAPRQSERGSPMR